MDPADLDRMSELSPFELKDTLIKLAFNHSERLMLNAGRASPNVPATVPRHGFFDYARIGRIIRTITQEYADEYQRAKARLAAGPTADRSVSS